MSIRRNQEINPYLLNNTNYQLAIKNSPQQTLITMSLFTPFFHTSSIPKTYGVLAEYLPQVLKTECYNDLNLPFQKEVKNTEIGHLFEHIILEYMCQIKIKNGHKKASFRGVTNWNWKKDSKGTFHIKVELKPEDLIFFETALRKSVRLLNRVLN